MGILAATNYDGEIAGYLCILAIILAVGIASMIALKKLQEIEEKEKEQAKWRAVEALREKQRKAKEEATANQIELCKKYGMSVLDEMTGVEFENFLAEVLKRMGYDTYTTKVSGDFGVDIMAVRDEKKYAIQCKHYTTGSVGIRSVQEVYAGRTFYETDYCVVATNSRFTDAAKELAKKTNVILWDGEKLVQILKQNTIFI